MTKRRTIRGGVPLQDASVEAFFVVRIYRGKVRVASFTTMPGESRAIAVARGFARIEAIIRSSAALHPNKPPPTDAEFAVTLYAKRIERGAEQQVTTSDLEPEACAAYLASLAQVGPERAQRISAYLQRRMARSGR
ncbi:MAG: hypothetical protein NW206_20000 [Hyphomonadaceae bacterium]|nr:hypothetical protein [Hyphomonadaceae bacterium]